MFQATPRVWFKPVSGSRHSEGFSEIDNLKGLEGDTLPFEDTDANNSKLKYLTLCVNMHKVGGHG